MANSKADKHWVSAKDELIAAANHAGIDSSIMIKIAGFESGFNEHARPISSNSSKNTVTQFDGQKAISSAYGYGQFLDGTWTNMLNQHGAKYGVPDAGHLSKSEANQYRNDTRLQAAMLAEFTKHNVELGGKIGG